MKMTETAYLDLRELIRSYVDVTMENGGEPNLHDFVQEYSIRELNLNEELFVENMLFCEEQRWIQLNRKGVTA